MNASSRKLALGITGILTSTVLISYLTQKIFNSKYLDVDGKHHRFVYPSLVTWMGCLFCTLYGTIYAHFKDKTPNNITLKERVQLGALFTLNYLPTNYALLFISYPLQVVAKNTRYILVVIVGVFFSRVQKSKELKLPKSKMIIAVIISLGAGLFMFYDSRKPSKENHFSPEKKWIGFLMLLVAITFDAFFSDSQAYCKSVFKPSQNQLFLAANLYGFLFIFLFALISGELGPSLRFLVRHSSLQKDLFLAASLQVVSQIAVYFVISNFKQHIYPLISTVRKLLTILFSIFIFNHHMHFYQWVSIAIVFMAMGYELYDEVESQEKNHKVRRERLRNSRQRELYSSREDINSRDSHSTPQAHPNYHMDFQPSAGLQDDSLSKYRYGWRTSQVTEGKEGELTPQKLHGQ